jgi:hypothetical protein
MLRLTTAAGSAIALFASSAAFAQADVTINQTGLDHSVSIAQVEDVLNSITVTQAGSLQSAQVHQTVPGGNNSTVTSQGVTGGLGENRIEARQTGSDNFVTVIQNSMANVALVTQDGSGNDLTIDQGFANGSGADGVGNNTLIRLDGDNNSASIRQNFATIGGGNDADIFQVNDDNDVTIDQEGSSNIVFIAQGDLGGAGTNSATAYQIGAGNLLAIGQNGTGNVALATQTGNNNAMFIDQGFNSGTGLGGDGNYAEGVQTGNNNTLTINQNMTTSGSGNRAVINQIGDGFDLTIDQEGSGMVNEITQM